MIKYKVIYGDTLSEIAQSHSTTVNQIMMINSGIKDKNLIYAGQIIDLPSQSKRLQALKAIDATNKQPENKMESTESPCKDKDSLCKEEEPEKKKYLHVIVLVSGTKNPVNDLFSFFLENPESHNSNKSDFSYWDDSFVEAVLKLKKDIFSKYEKDENFNIDFYKDFSWSGDNSYPERIIASKNLAKNLQSKYKAWQSNEVYFHLIGHSHGGNVINSFTNEIVINSFFYENWYIKTIVYLSTPFFQNIHQPESSKFHKSFKVFNIMNYFDLTQLFVADFTIIPSFENSMNELMPAIKKINKAFESLTDSVSSFVESLIIVKDKYIDKIKSYMPFGQTPAEANAELKVAYTDLNDDGEQLKKDIGEFTDSIDILIQIILNFVDKAENMPDEIKSETRIVLVSINKLLEELDLKAKLLVDRINNLEFTKIINLLIDLIDRLLKIIADFVHEDWIIKVIVLFSLNMLDYFDNTLQTNEHYTSFKSINPIVEDLKVLDPYDTVIQNRTFPAFSNKLKKNEYNLQDLFDSEIDNFQYSKWDFFDLVAEYLMDIYSILMAQIISDTLSIIKLNIDKYNSYVKLVASFNDQVNSAVKSANKGVHKVGEFFGKDDWGTISVGNEGITEYLERIEDSVTKILAFIKRIRDRNYLLFQYPDKPGIKPALSADNPGTLSYLATRSHSVSCQSFSNETMQGIVDHA